MGGVEKKHIPDHGMSQAWHSLDTDSDGRVSFSEYATWHVAECGASSLISSKTSETSTTNSPKAASALPDCLRQGSFHNNSRNTRPCSFRSTTSALSSTKSSMLDGEARSSFHSNSRTKFRSTSSNISSAKSSMIDGESRASGHRHLRSVTISRSEPVIVPVHEI